MKEFILELKTKSREDDAARTIKDLYARIAKLEKKVNKLEQQSQFSRSDFNGYAKDPNPVDPFAKYEKILDERKPEQNEFLGERLVPDPYHFGPTREIQLIPESLAKKLIERNERIKPHGGVPFDTDLEEMELRNKRMKKALNMEGTSSFTDFS